MFSVTDQNADQSGGAENSHIEEEEDSLNWQCAPVIT
jgi:hypothetical protein